MDNITTNIWAENLSDFGMPAYTNAISPMATDRPAADAFGAVEGINAGISAWRPPVC